MTDSVRLLLNHTDETPHVLHREDCSTIRHQVRGDLRIEQPRGGFRVLETRDDGTTLVGPVEGSDRFYFSAVYVTVDELPAVGRYRRCKICVPDAPPGAPPARVTRKQGSTLTATDLGRVTVDGSITRIEHTTTGTVVTLESGDTVTLGAGETLAFPKRNH
jgi:hypothetical protein